ncbi:MAG: hypothetical protein KDD59_07840 [Bdellovibrionales bacterium]|nr:hypothetical protein [Bdellovibrionales bacterium]
MSLFLFVSAVALVPFVEAQAATENSTDFVMCRNGKTVRTLRIKVADDNGSCKALYSKGGKDQVVGYGRQARSCKPFIDNVQNNLENANWRCQSLANMKITVPDNGATDESSSAEEPEESLSEDDGEWDE